MTEPRTKAAKVEHSIVHMCLDIRGAMQWSKPKLRGMFKHPTTGRPTSAEESWSMLADELAKGHKVLPLSLCEGFSYETGCPGHRREVTDDPEAADMEEPMDLEERLDRLLT